MKEPNLTIPSKFQQGQQVSQSVAVNPVLHVVLCEPLGQAANGISLLQSQVNSVCVCVCVCECVCVCVRVCLVCVLCVVSVSA